MLTKLRMCLVASGGGRRQTVQTRDKVCLLTRTWGGKWKCLWEKKKIGKGSQRHTIIGLEVRVEVVLGGITQAPSFRLVIICRLRLVLLPKDIIIMALWRFRHITSGLVMFAVS